MGKRQLKQYTLYKNGVYLKESGTMKELSDWLENIIGGSLYEGLRALRDGWIPESHSQLSGYTVTTADNMKVDREYFYELVDKIPEEKLEELRIVLLKMAIPEVEATPEELEAIRIGKEQFANGEFTSYNSISELEKDLMND